jgi:hypothetical protein
MYLASGQAIIVGSIKKKAGRSPAHFLQMRLQRCGVVVHYSATLNTLEVAVQFLADHRAPDCAEGLANRWEQHDEGTSDGHESADDKKVQQKVHGIP